MSMAGESVTRARPPWWMFVLGAAFVAYFSLLLHADLARAEPHGLEVQFVKTGVILPTVAPGSPADAAGLRDGDRVLTVDGREVGSRVEWQVIEANVSNGVPVVFEISRDGSAYRRSLTLSRVSPAYWGSAAGATLLGLRAAQGVTLVLALLVAFRRPADASARVGAWVLGATAVYSITLPFGWAASWRELPPLVGLALWVPFLSSHSLAAILFTFCASFPRRVIRRSWVWALTWLPMLGLLVLQSQFGFRAIYAPANSGRLADWTSVAIVVTMGYTVVAATILVTGYRRLSEPTDRRRVRVLALGTLLGLAAVLPVAMSVRLSGSAMGQSVFASPLVAVGSLVGLAFPASFAYAILRHRLFDVGFIVRRGLQYALARRFLLALLPAALTLFVLDLWLNRESPLMEVVQTRGWSYVALAGFALVAGMRRRQWLDALDRRFFRERYSGQQLLRGVIDEVRATSRPRDAAPRIVQQIDVALHPERVALFLRDGSGRYEVVATMPPETELPSLGADSKLLSLLGWMQRPVRVAGELHASWFGHLPSDDSDWVHQVGVELLVPVTVKHADPRNPSEI